MSSHKKANRRQVVGMALVVVMTPLAFSEADWAAEISTTAIGTLDVDGLISWGGPFTSENFGGLPLAVIVPPIDQKTELHPFQIGKRNRLLRDTLLPLVPVGDNILDERRGSRP
jgi:hypothetical protein